MTRHHGPWRSWTRPLWQYLFGDDANPGDDDDDDDDLVTEAEGAAAAAEADAAEAEMTAAVAAWK